MRRLVLALATFFLFVATPALANGFELFEQSIGVNTDSTLLVHERVVVNFDTPRHGIFRDIPVRYQTDAGNPFSLGVKVKSVTDLFEKPIPYDVSSVGDRLRVKIGDPDETVIGKQGYIIEYEVSRALLYLADHDELYWNVVTEPWGDLGTPEFVRSIVFLPNGISQDAVRERCFDAVGATGESKECLVNFAAEFPRVDSAGAYFSSDTGYLTVVVGWPKGFVHQPTFFESVRDWFADNGIIFFPLLVFIVLFFLWRKNGREPERKGPLVVQYDPPGGATPAEVGVLFDQKADLTDVTASIVHLAVKGYLIINEQEKGKYSFELKKTFENDAALSGFEHNLLVGIFGGSAPGTSVTVKSLENKFYKTLAVVKNEIYDACVKRGWYAKSPEAVRGTYAAIGFGYLFIVFFFARGFLSGPVSFLSVLAPGLLVIIFGMFMPARTRAGADAYGYALGFKEYLSKAEKYRLKWEEKENIFEKYLPYAMVFGVVDKWAKAFESIQMQPPDWYRGSWSNGFMPLYLANSLTSATSSIGRSLAVAPSSKGGGGFGGGGGGGGGFGGGGGGSW